MCYEPLLLHGRCIGALCLYARDSGNYTERNQRIAREIALRVAPALHDYLVDQRASQRVERAQIETFSLILHNISTPVTTMQRALNRLSRRLEAGPSPDPELLERVAVMRRQLKTISRVRSHFLTLYRPHESRLETFDIHAFLDERVHRAASEHPDMVATLDLADDISRVKADRTAVDLFLGVTLQNSFDALQVQTCQKRIDVRLRAISPGEWKHVGSPGRVLAVDVADNGPGVAPEIAESLFQVIKTTKVKGLGLGLNACRRVVRSALGEVYYHSEHPDGAQFTLLLPYKSL
jgi:nitrogen fixation/metabolism regulation signal transduction histidine kinase